MTLKWNRGRDRHNWEAKSWRYEAHEPRRGEFVISEHNVWIPGCYESLEAAGLAAVEFDNVTLEALQNRKNAENGGHSGVITMADLLAEQKEGSNDADHSQ